MSRRSRRRLPGTASRTCQRDAAHRRDNAGQRPQFTGQAFTGQAFTGVLLRAGVAISMDGKGASPDNVFVERLWRSVKHEEIHLRACDTVGEARASIGRYLALHNGRRPHSSLDRKTPDQAYSDRLPQTAAA